MGAHELKRRWRQRNKERKEGGDRLPTYEEIKAKQMQKATHGQVQSLNDVPAVIKQVHPIKCPHCEREFPLLVGIQGVRFIIAFPEIDKKGAMRLPS